MESTFSSQYAILEQILQLVQEYELHNFPSGIQKDV